MQSMSEDDTAYAAFLTELFSNSTPDRDTRVDSWIQQQYDSAVSEWEWFNCDSLSRPPSPSPSSSFGAHRTYINDSECSFHDALFFPPPHQNCEEQIRALRSIVQQMALHISRAASQSPRCGEDSKPLPALPPSPTTSLHQCTLSHHNRSRSSLTCVPCLPSVILSSEQAAQAILPSPSSFPLVDGCVHEGDGPFSCSNMQTQEQDGQLSCHVRDYREYVPRSPTSSNYSFANSRKTSFTTLSKTSVSPTDAIFLASPRSRENIALPVLSVDSDYAFLREPTMRPTCEHNKQSSPSLKYDLPHLPNPSPFTISLSITNEPSTSPISGSLPTPNGATAGSASQPLCTLKEHSQSRWSVTTTATGSVASPNVGSSSTSLLNSSTASKKMSAKLLATPPKRSRFMNIMSRFSPSRTATVSTKATTSRKSGVAYDPANDGETKEENKQKKKKLLSGKSSLASLRTSFSISRASFGSLRSPVSSPTEEVPPLPSTPTRTSSFAMPLDVPPPKMLTPKTSTGKNLIKTSSTQPIPPSASMVQISQGSLQITSSDDPANLAAASHIFLAPTSTTPHGSRISLLSTECVKMMASTSSVPTNRENIRPKSIVRSTEKTNGFETSSVLPVAGIQFPTPPTVHSTTSAAMEFTVPAKLANAMAVQSPRAPEFSGPSESSPQSMLKILPSPTFPKTPDLPGECFPYFSPASSPSGLVASASTKHTRNGVRESKS